MPTYFKLLLTAALLALSGCTVFSAEDTPIPPPLLPLASPVSDSPAAGICADSTGSAVTVILMSDMPSPRCARVLPEQHLQVANQTSTAQQVSLGGLTAEIPPGETVAIETPFGEYLAPGVHRLAVSELPPSASALPGSVEIWLVAAPPSEAPQAAPPSVEPTSTAAPASVRGTPLTTSAPGSTSTAPAAQAPVTSAVQVFNQPGEPYQTLFTIPLGEDGVEYFGAGVPEMQVSGPNAIALLDEGTFAVADPVANRIQLYDFSGKLVDTLYLLKLNIHLLTDMLSVRDELLLLEVGYGPMPETNHIYRLSREGALLNSYTLPPWATLENGLMGMQAGGAGEIYLRMQGGEELYRILDARGAFLPARVEGFDYFDRVYWATGPSGEAGEVRFETKFSHDLGGLQVLGALLDGSFFIVREDVVNDRVIQVDQTVHYLSASGEQLGVGRVPIGESYYPVTRPLVLASDGNVYALLPRSDGVAVLRLNFFEQLDPLLPGVAPPWVGAEQPAPGS